MSISVSGCASLSFIIGIRLWPPARILASGPNLASRVSACWTLVAFSYSTYAGTCIHPSQAPAVVLGSPAPRPAPRGFWGVAPQASTAGVLASPPSGQHSVRGRQELARYVIIGWL